MEEKRQIISQELDICGKPVFALCVHLGARPLVLAKAKRGFIMCGYLSLETAEKLGDAACLVRGVASIEDLLEAKIAQATSNALKLGIQPGMLAKEAIALLS